MEWRPVLYVIVSGAAPARELPALIAALTADWDTCVITTPEGSRFFDIARVAEMTGHPFARNALRIGGTGCLAAASAFAPRAAFNTINKWAAGIGDTLALGLLNERRRLGLPIVTVRGECGPGPPSGVGRSVATLRGCGIRVIFDPGHLPDDESPGQAEFPWGELRAELAQMRVELTGGKQAPA